MTQSPWNSKLSSTPPYSKKPIGGKQKQPTNETNLMNNAAVKNQEAAATIYQPRDSQKGNFITRQKIASIEDDLGQLQ